MRETEPKKPFDNFHEFLFVGGNSLLKEFIEEFHEIENLCLQLKEWQVVSADNEQFREDKKAQARKDLTLILHYLEEAKTKLEEKIAKVRS